MTYLQYILPQNLLSRFIGYFANCRTPWIKNLLIRWFIKRYNVNMQEAEHTRPEDYTHFNAFFTRKLHPEARSLASDPQVILCPADGTISQFGTIDGQTLLQAKGLHYSLERLLGSKKHVPSFKNGQFVTIYLSPKDYHRVHMPITGRLIETTYIPGRLFSVNPATTKTVPSLFTRNERLASLFDTEIGKVAVIMVGAMIVASIHTTWAGKITPNQYRTIHQTDYTHQNITLQRGEYFGHFELGSTVILLFEPNRVNLAPTLPTQFGHPLGTLITP